MIRSEKEVIEALQASVVTAVASSTNPNMPVKFLNVSFNVPDSGAWLELIYIPNPPPDPMWGNEKIFRGIFRILLHWPNNGGGSYQALTYLDNIASSYDKYKLINSKLHLLKNPRLSSVIEKDKELLLPLTLEYCSFLA